MSLELTSCETASPAMVTAVADFVKRKGHPSPPIEEIGRQMDAIVAEERRSVEVICPVCQRSIPTATQDGHTTYVMHGSHYGPGGTCRTSGLEVGSSNIFPLTEAGDAEFFASLCGRHVRHNHREKSWLLFNGQHWIHQSNGEVDRLALYAIRKRQKAALALETEEKRVPAIKWSIAGESRKRHGNLLALARSIKPIADSGDGWDADPWLLGVENGVVDLRTGALRNGRPEDRIVKVAPLKYDPEASCPRWEQFVGEVFRSSPDITGYVQRCLGYSLTGVIAEQVFWILWGSGANGKGTLLETFGRHVLGLNDYAWTMPFPTAGWSNAMSEYQKAKLDGRRLVMSSEIERRGRLNEALIKTLTGDDVINGRNPYGDPFQFVPVAKFWLRVNDKPVIRDQSHAMWRRVRLIPFVETFPVNGELPKVLEGEAVGILAWAVRGCLEWQRSGLNEPDVVRVATAEYRGESNPLAEFFAERCDFDGAMRCRARDLFNCYAQWCRDRQIPDSDRLTSNAFASLLSLDQRIRIEEDTRRHSPSRGVWYVGIGVGLNDDRGEL